MIPSPKDEFKKVEEICQQEGFSQSNNFDKRFRYDIIRDPEYTLILGAKIPVVIPLNHQPPIELVSFYLSFVFRPKRFEEPFIRYMIASFKEVVQKIPPYTHDFNIQSVQEKVLSAVQKYYPDENTVEPAVFSSEIPCLNFIRDKILKNPASFEQYIYRLSQDVLDIYRDFNLTPTLELAPEFEKGYPRGRENLVVTFHNPDFDDYFIEEPGSIAYWRNYQYKSIWIRVGMQTVTPFIWYEVLDEQKFHLNYLIHDWLVFCRALIKPSLSVMDSVQFDTLTNQMYNLKPFSEKQMIQDVQKEKEINALFFPSLYFESKISPDLIHPHFILFESAPSSLEELSSVYDFTRAKVFIQNGNYNAAKQLLLECREKLKKFHHTYGQVKILLRLNEIAMTQDNIVESIALLCEAMDLARSGKIPYNDIVEIHLLVARSYAKNNEMEKADAHFNIAIKFLKALPDSKEITPLLFRAYIEIAKIKLEAKDMEGSDEAFKEVVPFINKSEIFEFFYYYERSIFYAANKNESKQMLALTRALNIRNTPPFETVKANVALAKIFLYSKHEPQKALEYLTTADKITLPLSIEGLTLKIQINEILVDTHKMLQNLDLANATQQEVDKLREKLDRLN